jgi:hypothetical protein
VQVAGRGGSESDTGIFKRYRHRRVCIDARAFSLLSCTGQSFCEVWLFLAEKPRGLWCVSIYLQ